MTKYSPFSSFKTSPEIICRTVRRRLSGPLKAIICLPPHSFRLGLLKQDFIGLDADLPYVCVTKYPWRNLKTSSSERKIPLVGEALWAARRIIEADTA
jgi:hypothetical protein